MLNQNLNLRYATRWPWRLHRPYVVTFACLLLVFPSGCGFSRSAPRSEVPVEIIRGRDSAGATIELEKRGDDLTRARVIDVVLGTGEAEIISTTDGGVEFTIDFPGGAAITYSGRQADTRDLDNVMLSGTWRQHPGGVFGEDFGTWDARSRLDDIP